MRDRLAQLEAELARLAAEINDLRAERDRLTRELEHCAELRRQVEGLRIRNQYLEAERGRLRERLAALLRRVDAAIADSE
ncbi:hypothetical protein [Thiohalorhabdus methylotrophus]|uniref:Cell division protein ZapB n=1 Tax=Thiohalorhabdus methylotrophus TaxID=3242694 RepID=A0ABV4TVV4_9GAMM